jgi:ubiquinone/menaquinone biosynthesis C-methylase UbiE
VKNSKKIINNRNDIIDSYNNIFEESNRLLEMPSFYSWVLDHLNPEPQKYLLDIATGLGSLPKIAQERKLRATGIDISIRAIKKAINSGNHRFLVCDGEILPFPSASFDYVTNLGSLEHFTNPSIGIQEIFRVLKPNGKAGIFLPNSYYLLDIIRNVMREGYGPSHNQPIERFATINEWGDLIQSNGLKIIKVKRYNILFPKSKRDWNYMIKKPKRIIASIFSPFIPFNLSYSFLYICKK